MVDGTPMGSAAKETAASDPAGDLSGAGAALSVDGVSHRFGAKMALDNVSLTVATGSFTTLLGVNGAGKTTLFNLITRLYGARTGHIEVRSHDLRRYSRQALAQMGMVFQSPSLDRALTVRQNLYYHGALHGLGPRRDPGRRAEMLDRLRVAIFSTCASRHCPAVRPGGLKSPAPCCIARRCCSVTRRPSGWT